MTDQAYEMFRALETHLNASLPTPHEMAKVILEVVHASRGKSSESHKAFPEGAFLNHFALPALYQFVSMFEGMDGERARIALLSESYRQMKAYASGSPARSSQHPFQKVVGVSTETILRR